MRLFVAVYPPAQVRADLHQTLTTTAPPKWQADVRAAGRQADVRAGSAREVSAGLQADAGAGLGLAAAAWRQADVRAGSSREVSAGRQADVGPGSGRAAQAGRQADLPAGLGPEASAGRQADVGPGSGQEAPAGQQADLPVGLGPEASAGRQADLRAGLGREGLAGRRGLERAGLRLTPVERWHLTLVFLGEVADERLGDVERALDGVPDARRISREPSRGPDGHPGPGQPGRGIGLWLAGGGRFDNGGSSALWTGVAGDLAGLSGLQADIRAALALAGLPADERAFRPHLTIAYARGGRASVALADYVGPAWSVDEFVLVRSQFDEGGGYDRLGAWAC